MYGCLLSVAYPNEESPDGLHTGMFLPALYGQASAEQTHWVDRAERYDFLGTYAQTELGHGNFYIHLGTLNSCQSYINAPLICALF